MYVRISKRFICFEFNRALKFFWLDLESEERMFLLETPAAAIAA